MPDIRVLTTPAEFNHLPDIEIAVWGLPARDVVSGNIVRAITLNGGVAHGAYDGDLMIGMSLALPAFRSRKRLLWSHMAGVLPDYQGQGIGFALKQAQREWALKHGYDEMRWTFDPLQRGNAHFNLHLLGCYAETYYVDFYGQMEDAINVSAPTDRLEAVWKLKDERVKQLTAGNLPTPFRGNIERVILRNHDSAPELNLDTTTEQANLFLEIPRRARDLPSAKMIDWRLALREAMQHAIAQGYRLVDLVERDEQVYYRLERQPGYMLYVLECSDGSLYTGIALELERRVAQHNAGKGAAYTRSRRPVRLLAAWSYPSKGAALKAELALKNQNRGYKLKLLESDAQWEGGIRQNAR
ncbi:MAG: GNAT family N-acetyltransferase [Chloroflexota bacterium]|nr:GNAT family N-acetyltransferase [Chloroflexota bacterium]